MTSNKITLSQHLLIMLYICTKCTGKAALLLMLQWRNRKQHCC